MERYRRFVAETMAKRIPMIVRNAGDGFDTETVARLEAISRAIAAGAPMVVDLGNWPFAGWEGFPARVNGRRIGEAPFFDFEFWMYFRILEAVRFADTRADPFRATKHRDLDRHLKWADDALGRVSTLAEGLALALDAGSVRRLNLIADNFGGEFVADLILCVIAAEAGVEVVVHVKQLPMFVSDTTADDVTILFDRLGSDGFGKRLQNAVQRGGIRFAAHAFWSSPKFFDRLPLDELGEGPDVLNVLKGDLNFRRAIGDVTVPVETPFQDLPVLPAAPLLSLRSIKSYCLAGMTDWPTALSKHEFPMDGSIVAVQQVPVRDATASAGSSSNAEPPLRRARRWFRRAG